MNNCIDFVVTWVDSSDTVWANDFVRYKYGQSESMKTSVDAAVARYRDWGLLKYWFRGVEKFAPWVRYVHFVTYGHVPSWLDTTNPKLKIVRHEDYISRKYLPIFNSNPLEIMLHKIPDLAEHFVYFNDDFYITKPITSDYFFYKGKPCEMAVAKNHHSMDGVMLGITKHNMNIINHEFNLFHCVLRHPSIWFRPNYKGFLKLTIGAVLSGKIVSLLDTHAPSPFLKKTFYEVWSKYENILYETMKHRFRSCTDISPWLFRYWQIAKGNIEPRNLFDTTGVFYNVENNIDYIVSSIKIGKYAVVVLNDSENINDIDNVIKKVNSSFADLLPDKSSYEK